MQKTIVDGVALWSRRQPERNIFFNSYFIAEPNGNLIVDPLALEADDANEIELAGGAAWIVITNRDHERDARNVAERFGAKIAASEPDAKEMAVQIDRVLHDGDTIGSAEVVALDGLKTAGEFALYFPSKGAVLVGDAVLGDPAGSLRMMPDEKLGDPVRAARSLRALRRMRPRHLLVGDGTSVFDRAYEALTDLLESRTDAHTNLVNIEQLNYTKTKGPGRFQDEWAEVGFLLGAERLGYAVTRLEPGIACCPLHWHIGEEELFIVWDGTPTLESPHGEMPLRRGDFVCLPTRPFGSHRLVNNGPTPATVILIANTNPLDACFYPDSKKVLVEATGTLVRSEPILDYFDGEA